MLARERRLAGAAHGRPALPPGPRTRARLRIRGPAAAARNREDGGGGNVFGAISARARGDSFRRFLRCGFRYASDYAGARSLTGRRSLLRWRKDSLDRT